MFRKSGFVLPSTDEKEATPAPVVAPIEGTPTEGTPVEGTSPVPVQ